VPSSLEQYAKSWSVGTEREICANWEGEVEGPELRSLNLSRWSRWSRWQKLVCGEDGGVELPPPRNVGPIEERTSTHNRPLLCQLVTNQRFGIKGVPHFQISRSLFLEDEARNLVAACSSSSSPCLSISIIMIMAIVLYPAAFAAGIITHLLYFNRGEHHMYGVRYLQAYTFLVISTVLVATKSYEQPLSISLMLIGPAFLSGLLTSLLTYRLFFSPLNKFPGPYLSRISNLWLSFGVVGKSSQLHIKVQDIHAKYGDFVRIGSNDLSITDPKAVQIVYGQGSKCRKSSWYDQDSPLNSMHTTRSRKVHALRRRVWSPAFSDKAIRGYEKRIQPYVDELVRKIEGFDGGAVNVADWFNFFGYDVMGDVAFGKGFGMIEGGEDHFAIGLLKEAMQPMSLLRVYLFSFHYQVL
jgi:hypothetical protein